MPGYHDPIQHHRRLCSFSLNGIEEYFAELNPIAKRIAYDINDTKANYGQLWNTLDYHEQNDIINDTLIKPEISLRYFDNFLTPTQSNSPGNSYQSSTDSLTAIVLKNAVRSRYPAGDKEKNISSTSYGEKFNTHDIKNSYLYDGRNLHTFGMQKVALKSIQDDTLGCFRDEHSRPFCYRTKSQINLFGLPHTEEPMAAQNKIFDSNIAPDDEATKKALHNYHRLQRQLNTNLKEKKSHESQNSLLNHTSIKPSIISANRKILKSDSSHILESRDKTPLISKSTKSSMIQNYISSTQTAPEVGVNYIVFSDSYNAAEECSNLLYHCAQSDLTAGSCSSAATSDDDEKTLEEDVHLLDNDSNIRKGFDFLNNW